MPQLCTFFPLSVCEYLHMHSQLTWAKERTVAKVMHESNGNNGPKKREKDAPSFAVCVREKGKDLQPLCVPLLTALQKGWTGVVVSVFSGHMYPPVRAGYQSCPCSLSLHQQTNA